MPNKPSCRVGRMGTSANLRREHETLTNRPASDCFVTVVPDLSGAQGSRTTGRELGDVTRSGCFGRGRIWSAEPYVDDVAIARANFNEQGAQSLMGCVQGFVGFFMLVLVTEL